MEGLVDLVRDDIRSFLEGCDELLFNERDLQIHLAMSLQKSRGPPRE